MTNLKKEWIGDDLKRVLLEAGLASGDSVIVHSSFRTLAPMAGGPETVVNVLLDILGPSGNLMVPVFNYLWPLPEPYFDPAVVPGRTGIIPEIVRKRPGAVRSLHPTHSVAVIGPDARRLTENHLSCRTLGKGSPIDRLAKMGGKVLLLGVGHTSNTTIHVGEEYAEIPKGGWQDTPLVAKVLLPDGSVVKHEIDTSPSCSLGFGTVEYGLRRSGEIRDGRLGSCSIQLMAGEDVICRTVELLSGKPDILLCSRAECRPCTAARANLCKPPRFAGGCMPGDSGPERKQPVEVKRTDGTQVIQTYQVSGSARPGNISSVRYSEDTQGAKELLIYFGDGAWKLIVAYGENYTILPQWSETRDMPFYKRIREVDPEVLRELLRVLSSPARSLLEKVLEEEG